MRGRLDMVVLLLILFGSEICCAMYALLMQPDSVAQVKGILEIVFTPTVALLGSFMGFYFASEK